MQDDSEITARVVIIHIGDLDLFGGEAALTEHARQEGDRDRGIQACLKFGLDGLSLLVGERFEGGDVALGGCTVR